MDKVAEYCDKIISSNQYALSADYFAIFGNVNHDNKELIFAVDQRNNNTAGDAVVQTIASRYQVAAGDYFELFVFQNSGAALAISATANYSPEFWAEWVAV